MNRKELLAQCQEWCEQDEHQKIIDALEEIPAGKRTRELNMALARAYNNQSDDEELDWPESRTMLKRSIELMSPYEDELDEDYVWNFEMGFAHLFLDQEGPALWYLEKALELYPGDDFGLSSKEVIEGLINNCKQHLALPDFQENFRQRTIKAWEAFVAREAELRRIVDDSFLYGYDKFNVGVSFWRAAETSIKEKVREVRFIG